MGERNQPRSNVSALCCLPGHSCPLAVLPLERSLTETHARCCQEPTEGCHIQPGVALLPRTRSVPKPPPTRCIQMLAASQTDAKASQPIPRPRSWQPLTSRPSWPRGQKPQEPTGGMCQASLCGRQVRSPQPGSTDCSQNLLDEGVVQDRPAPGAIRLSGCDGLNCASSSGKFKS